MPSFVIENVPRVSREARFFPSREAVDYFEKELVERYESLRRRNNEI